MIQTKKPTFESINGGGEQAQVPSFLPKELDDSLRKIEEGFDCEVTADGVPRWSLYNDVVYSDATGTYWALFPDQLADGKLTQVWRALPGEEEFGWAGMRRVDVLRLPSVGDHPIQESRSIYMGDGEQWYCMGLVTQQVKANGDIAILTAVRRRPTVVLGREAMADVVLLDLQPSIA